MKKRTPVLILILLCLATLSAAQSPLASLFVNDSVWMKEAMAPLVRIDGKDYIPCEICSYFDYIKLTNNGSDNVLIENTVNGSYVSFIVSEKKAAVNGEVYDVDGFVQNGVPYIEADFLAENLGIMTESFNYDGNQILRLFDSGANLSLDEIIKANEFKPENPDDEAGGELEGGFKKIYIFTKYDSGDYYSVCDTLDKYGISYTVCLSASDGIDEMIAASERGEYALISDTYNVGVLDGLNSSFASALYKKTHVVFAEHGLDAETREHLQGKGYVTFTPDFVLNPESSPYRLLSDIQDFLRNHDRCYLYMNESYNVGEFAELFSVLDTLIYQTYNIGTVN